MERAKPEGEYCYKISVFGKCVVCPYLDQALFVRPICEKHDQELSEEMNYWDVSGHILKCKECLG